MSVSKEAWFQHLAKKTLMWHGTSTRSLRSILKEGLKADPPHSTYGEETTEETISMETYGGVYLAQTLREAARHAANASDNGKYDQVYIGVATQTSQPVAAMDEDDLTRHLLGALRLDDEFRSVEEIWNEPKTWEAAQAWINSRDYDGLVERFWKGLAYTLVGTPEIALKQVRKFNPQIQQQVSDALRAMMTYMVTSYWNKNRSDPQTYSKLKETVNVLSSSLKRLAEFKATLRMQGDIGYRGATRIVLVASTDVLRRNFRVYYSSSEEALTYLKRFLGIR